ncbi:nuclear fusion defective 6, mitochondrial-like protein [Drosera capensis]
MGAQAKLRINILLGFISEKSRTRPKTQKPQITPFSAGETLNSHTATMSAVYATAARSVLRSTCRTAAPSRLSAAVAAAAKPKSRPPPPLRSLKGNAFSQSSIFRSPVELSCCLDSLLPYHTATATALLTSMLSVPRGYGWTPEGKDQTR